MNEPVQPEIPATESSPSADSRKHILAAALDGLLEERLAPALSRDEFEVNYVHTLRSALELVRLIPFQVVMAPFPPPDGELMELLAAVREPESPSRGASLLAFAAASEVDAAETRLGPANVHVLSHDLDDVTLQGKLLGMLRARVRVAMRVMARLTVRLEGLSPQFLCQTRDLSRSGMLAITDNHYPVGTAVRFLLDLPEDREPVRGEAEVVRHAIRPRDTVDGLGLRFLSFAGADAERLARYLARHGA